MMESSFLKGTLLRERKWADDFLFDFETMKIEHLQAQEGGKELENELPFLFLAACYVGASEPF